MTVTIRSKFIIPKTETEKIKSLFDVIKLSGNFLTELSKDEINLYVSDKSEVLITAKGLDIQNIEVNNNNNEEKENTESNNSEDLLDDILTDIDSINTVSEDYPKDKIITQTFDKFVEIIKTAEPESDILVIDTPSEYIYRYLFKSGNRSYVIKYTDFKLEHLDELQSIAEFKDKINELVDSTKLDSIMLEEFSNIQKFLKSAKNGIFIAIETDTDKIVKLVGSVDIYLNDSKDEEINEDNLRYLEIQLPKFLNVDNLVIELYKVKNEDNEDIYLLKYVPNTDDMLLELSIFEVPKDLEQTDFII